MLSSKTPFATTEQKFEYGVEILVETFDRSLKYYLNGVPQPRRPLTEGNPAFPTSFYFEGSTTASNLPQLSLKKVVEEVPVTDSLSNELLAPLANLASSTVPSSRIGSHYSPLAGAFTFTIPFAKVARPAVAIPKFCIGADHASSLPLTVFLQAEMVLDKHILCKFIDESGKVCYRHGEILGCDNERTQFHVLLSDVQNQVGEKVCKVVSRACILFAHEIPSSHEERLAVAASNREDFEKRFRTDLFLQLWDREGAAEQALHESILKRVLKLATHGFGAEFAPVIQEELIEMRRACGAAMNLAIFEYFCLNEQFLNIIKPLNLWTPESTVSMLKQTAAPLFPASRGLVMSTAKLLSSQMSWREPTRRCLMNLRNLWQKKYAKLVLIDTRYPCNETTPFSSFLARARTSLEVAITMIRMQYITDIDISMVSDLAGHFSYVFRDRDLFQESDLCRFFKAIKMQMISNLRELCCVSLRKITEFFSPQPQHPALYSSPSDSYFEFSGSKPQNRPKLMLELRLVGCEKVEVVPDLMSVEEDLHTLLKDLSAHFCSFPQAETVIMTTLQLPAAVLNCISFEDVEFQEALNAVSATVAQAKSAIAAVREAYSRLTDTAMDFLSNRQRLDIACSTLTDAARVNKKFSDEVRFIRSMIQKVQWTTPTLLHCGLIVLDCTDVKENLLKLWRDFEEQILKSVKHRTLDTCLSATIACQEMEKRVSTRPKNAEELEELRLFSEQALLHLEKIRSHECMLVFGSVELLESLEHAIDGEAFDAAVELLQWPDRLQLQLDSCAALYESDIAMFVAQLVQFQQEIHQLIERFSIGTTKLLDINEMEKSDLAIGIVRSLRQEAETIKKELEVCANRQRILRIDYRDSFGEFYPPLNTFETLEQFWFAIGDSSEHIQRFYDAPIADLNVEKMVDRCQTWRRLLRSATRCVRGYPYLFALGRKQELAIARFQEVTPMLELISLPGVRLPHWREISKRLGLKVGFEIFPSDSSVTVQRLLDEGIMLHFDEVALIVKQACTDFEAECILEKMRSDAKKQTFTFDTLEMSCGQVTVLGNCPELIGFLDSHVATSQHLHSRYALSGALAVAAGEWELMLVAMQNTMTTWNSLQREWLQLRPTIFGEQQVDDDHGPSALGSGIVLEFKVVDTAFQSLIEEVDRPNQNLFTIITNEGLPEKLTSIQVNMSLVREGLMILVNAKRAALPRFWLLDDNEMLSCLSAANIRSLVCHLHRMFPRLNALEVPNNRNEVLSFISSDNVVLRCEPPYPVTQVPIEDWMRGLEESLRKSLRTAIENAFNEAGRLQLRSWVIKNSGQLVDVALRMRYSSDISDVLTAVGANGLQSYLKRLARLTEEFFTLQTAALSSAEKVSVTNAISFNLSCQEEVQAMIREGIHNTEQLEQFPMMRTVPGEGDNIDIRFLHVSVRYGMEFLGNCSSAMITPSFFKNSRSALLSHAVSARNLLCGSWGVGKTKFATDFASYLGCYLWSFQCTPSLTLNSFTNVLRAIISTGGFVLLEDVDLLRAGVMADFQRIAQTVDEAKEAGKDKALFYLRTGASPVLVNISPKFGIIAATSKEYGALPDLLKSMYRPIFLQPIDFSLLARMYFSACGFVDRYVSLGDALGSLFEQFHEVLPGVFTPSALALTIRKANLARSGQQIEDCVADALEDLLSDAVAVKPELVPVFVDRVQALRDDVLPALTNNRLTKLGSLSNIQRGNSNIFSMNQSGPLGDALAANKFTVVYGPHFSGKTQQIESWIKKNIKDPERDVIRIAPKALPASVYYGSAGQKGLLSWIYRECSVPGVHLVVFDDCLLNESDLPWALCAESSSRFQLDGECCSSLSRDTRFIATSSDLSNASPRIVSKFTLFALTEKIPLADYVLLLAGFRKDAIGDDISIVVDIFGATIPQLVHFTSHGCGWTLVHQALNLFDKWLSNCSGAFLSLNAEFSKTKIVCHLAMFAVAWSIGLSLDKDERVAFNAAFHALNEELTSVANQYDPTVELFPPGDLLDFAPSPTGWKSVADETPSDLWTQTHQQDIGPGRPSRFVVPVRTNLLSSHIIELLIRCGQNVIVTGDDESGKSTILARAGMHPSWIAQALSANRDADPNAIQQFVTHRTQKKKEGVHGPLSGKQLVLLIDDLHVTASQEGAGGPNTSGMAHVLAFLGSRQKVCTSTLGVVTLSDAVFLASCIPGLWTSRLLRNAVCVRLPKPTGKAVVETVAMVVELSTPPRLHAIARDLTAFLLLVHERFQALSDDFSEESLNETGVFHGFAARYEQQGVLPPHVIDAACTSQHCLFRAVDAARAVFSTACGDSTVPRNIASEVFRVYSSEWRATDSTALAKMVLEAAAETVLLNDGFATAEDIAAVVTVDPELASVERFVGQQQEAKAREWIHCFNDSPAVEMSPIDNIPLQNATQITTANPAAGIQMFRMRLARLHPVSYAGDPNASSQIIFPMTTIIPTPWMLYHLPRIVSHIEHSDNHLALTGSQTFGVVRLLRVATSVASVPLYIPQHDKPYYDHAMWRSDCRSFFRYASKKGARASIYVPNVVLEIPGVLSDIDSFLRCGNYVCVFSPEELSVLLDTAKKSNQLTSFTSNMEKSDPLVEYTRRLQRQITFILHFSSESAFVGARDNFPSCRSSMIRYHIGDLDEWTSESHASLAKSVLLETYDISPELTAKDASMSMSSEEMMVEEKELLRKEATRTSLVLGEIFHRLYSRGGGGENRIVEEQMIDFARLVGSLQLKRIPETQHVWKQASSFAKIFRHLQSQMSADNAAKREISPELNTLSFKISDLEARVSAMQRSTDQKQAEFEKLEAHTVLVVTNIETKKHQGKLLREATTGAIAEARARVESMSNEPKAVKQLCQMVVAPPRVKVLMDLLFLFLKEDPKAAGKDGTKITDPWVFCRKLIEDPKFASRLIEVNPQTPSSCPSVESIRPLAEQLESSKMPCMYAIAIADYVLSVYQGLVNGVQILGLETEVAESRIEMLAIVDDMERAREELASVVTKLQDERKLLAVARDRRSQLFTQLQVCDKRLVRFNRVAHCVERFQQHVLQDPELLAGRAKNCFGDIIIAAAKIVVIGHHGEQSFKSCVEVIAAALDEMEIHHGDPHADDFQFVLQQEADSLSDAVLDITLPRQQYMSLCALTLRLFCRWPLFAGASKLFEDCLQAHFKEVANDCLIVSASDPQLVSHVLESIRCGYAIIVTDFNANEVVRALRPILPLCTTMQSHMQDSNETLTVNVYGRNLRVNRKFYIVFTAYALNGDDTDEVLSTMTQWFVVHRFADPPSSRDVIQQAIIRTKASGCYTALQNYNQKAKEYRSYYQELIRAKYHASKLLGSRADHLLEDDRAIVELSTDIARMEKCAGHHTRLREECDTARAAIYHKWNALAADIGTIVEQLQRLEKKLRRSVCCSVISDVVQAAFGLNKVLLEMIYPDKLSALSEKEQSRLILIAFVQEVINVFAPGWPLRVRHIFLLCILGRAANFHLVTIERGKPAPISTDVVRVVEKLIETFTMDPDDENKDKLMEGCRDLNPRDKSPRSTQDGDEAAFSSATSDIRNLMDAFKRCDLEEAEYFAELLCLRCAEGILYVPVAQLKSIEYLPPLKIRVDPMFCTKTAQSARVPLVVVTEDALETMTILEQASTVQKATIHTRFVSEEYTNTNIVEDLLHVSRSRLRGLQKSNWYVLFVRPSSMALPEMLHSLMTHLCASLQALGENGFNSGSGTSSSASPSSPVKGGVAPEGNGGLSTIVWIVLDAALPQDIISTVQSNAVNVTFDLLTPKTHICDLIRNGYISSDEWRSELSTSHHLTVRGVIRSLVFLHAALAHVRRVDHMHAVVGDKPKLLWYTDIDLLMLVKLMRLGFTASSRMWDAFATMRTCAYLIYSARCDSRVEDARLLAAVAKFVHQDRIVSHMPLNDTIDIPAEADLEEVAEIVSASESSLCEIGGDLLSGEWLNQQARRKTEGIMTVALSRQHSRRKSSTHSLMRYRTSVALPEIPSFRRYILPTTKVAESWESEDINPTWQLELQLISAELNSATTPSNKKFRLDKMRQHVMSLRSIAPAKTKEVWLRGLQFPLLFLHTWVQDRICDLVFVRRAGVAAKFSIVVLAGKSAPLSNDLVLIGATLPERRVRNERTRRNSVVQHTLFNNDDDEARIVPDTAMIILRAAPSPSRNDTTIPLLQSKNLSPKSNYANEEDLDQMDGFSAPRTVQFNDGSPSSAVLDTFASVIPVPLVVDGKEVLLTNLLVESMFTPNIPPSFMLGNTRVAFEPAAPGAEKSRAAAPRRKSTVSPSTVTVTPTLSPSTAALQKVNKPSRHWLPAGLRYSVEVKDLPVNIGTNAE